MTMTRAARPVLAHLVESVTIGRGNTGVLRLRGDLATDAEAPRPSGEREMRGFRVPIALPGLADRAA
jgi:hypothetical protein